MPIDPSDLSRSSPAGANSPPRVLRWNEGTWNGGGVWGGAKAAPAPLILPEQFFTLNSHSSMEHHEVTKQRSIATLSVWKKYVPTLTIGTQGPSDLEAFIDGFEPRVQARTEAQDDFDAAFRAVQGSLLRLKILGTKVPQMIEAVLDEDQGLMKDVDDVYAVSPRTEVSILKRARMVYPVWLRANAALAALTPSQPPITRPIAGVVFTVAMLKTLLEGFTDLAKAVSDQESELNKKREAVWTLDRAADQLNKRWYKLVKARYDEGQPEYEALAGIPTEPSTPAPEPVEIATVTQGGEEGLQVLIAYVPGGGEHATTKLVKWQVVGTDAEFTHSAPLDASGNALGPFPVGKVVKVITEVSNSAATRTTAVRTITMETPIT